MSLVLPVEQPRRFDRLLRVTFKEAACRAAPHDDVAAFTVFGFRTLPPGGFGNALDPPGGLYAAGIFIDSKSGIHLAAAFWAFRFCGCHTPDFSASLRL